MRTHARVVVIGGGVVGCSVLYHLARAGWTDVVLIERSELTSGSSWHAAGGFHTLNLDPNVAKLQAYTVSLYRKIEALSGQSCGLHLTGGVMLADSPERMDFLRLAHAKGRYLGMQTELITPSEAKAMFPLIDERHFVGACMVNRISYTGDLGYEIWMEPAYERRVYDAIKESGREAGIVDFGMRALLSMRLEKNFPTWFRELRPIYGPYEAGLDRFVKLSKDDFVGRDAAAREQAEGPRLRRVSFLVDAGDADLMGDEPIWARVGDTDHGTIEPPHGYGAPRFDAAGQPIPLAGDAALRDGDWRVVGWVTSGGYAHFVERSMAQGYVPAALAAVDGEGVFEIEILGVRRRARIAMEPPFDPRGERMRG